MNRPVWSRRSATVDGAAVTYHRTGGAHPVVVLLHGLTDDGLCWTRVARALDDAFDVVMPDAVGHGFSSRVQGAFSVPLLAAQLEGLLDALGIRDAVLFGHSMGAITALQVAADRPDLARGLVLEDPPLDVATVPLDHRHDGMRRELRLWSSLPDHERRARAMAEHPTWHRLETDAWADAKARVDLQVLDHLGLFDGFDWLGPFERLVVPGLLVTADAERGALVTETSARAALDRWPTGTRLHVPGAGHSIHRDRWDESLGGIREFVASLR